MTIKSILYVFGGSGHELGTLHTAMTLAKEYEARLRVLHISPDPYAYLALFGGEPLIINEVTSAMEKENKERLFQAKQKVMAAAARHQLPLDSHDASFLHASVHFLHVTGPLNAIITKQGRLSDIIILGCSPDILDASDDFNHLTPALFNTGRPVLLMPKPNKSEQEKFRTKKLAWAWNGSLEAVRALSNAMPFMKKAEKLYVLMAHKNNEAFDFKAEIELVDYLKSHDLQFEFVSIYQGLQSAGEVILTKTKELGVDALVMGAYGHSRFREMVLGGFTEHMLRHAEIPLILSH